MSIRTILAPVRGGGKGVGVLDQAVAVARIDPATVFAAPNPAPPAVKARRRRR